MSFFGRLKNSLKKGVDSNYQAASPVMVSPKLYDPLIGAMVFRRLVYHGADHVPNCYLKLSTEQSSGGKGARLMDNAVEKLIANKLASSALPEERAVDVQISDKGVRIVEPSTDLVIEDCPYTVIPFTGSHFEYKKVFCLICEDADASSPTLSVHLLTLPTEPETKSLVKTVTEACTYAYSCREGRRAQHLKSSRSAICLPVSKPKPLLFRNSLRSVAEKSSAAVNQRSVMGREENAAKGTDTTDSPDSGDDDDLDSMFAELARTRSLPNVHGQGPRVPPR